MLNQLCRLSKAKYVMKLDAHCSMDEGFVCVKMIDAFKELGDNVTIIPAMYNFHVFDWKCNKCGNRWYMGAPPHHCQKSGTDGNKPEHINNDCDNTKDFSRRLVWKPRWNKRTEFWMFDSEPHFQYFNSYRKRPEFQTELAETMSLIGACFMLTRDKWWELNVCDESFGSWGSQGVQLSCLTWLTGGRLITNKRTWFAHLFRTQTNFGFPYPQSNTQVQNAKKWLRIYFLIIKYPIKSAP